jgi:xanthine dehydrogenase YagS FAD-binding subunit
MRPFSFHRPTTPDEAVALFATLGEGARFVAGGTTLFDLMKLDIERPRHLIDISAIRGMDGIDENGDTLRIEALAPMAAVATHPAVLRDYPVLAESLAKAASPQLRNMASIGGNLLQRTRCPYFRNGAGGTYPCNKREPGSGCAAIGGLDRGQAVLGTSAACNAVSPGDWPVALVAMDAAVEVRGPFGQRLLPVEELYRLPGETPQDEFTLRLGEMIVAVVVPKAAAGRASTYHKIRDRESFSFALASAAVALDMDGGLVRGARIALGGVATKPWRARDAESVLVGADLDAEIALAVGRAAFAEGRPGRHNAFKLELGAQVVADALLIAAERSRT